MGAPLGGRVRRLEARLRAAHACPVCAGRGGLAIVLEDDPIATSSRSGCPRCGRVGVRVCITTAARPPGIDAPHPGGHGNSPNTT